MFHSIETRRARPQSGHFQSPITLIIEGANRAGGPGGWFLVGWDAGISGRVEDGGPLVPGPVALLGGLPSSMSDDGTKSRHDAARRRNHLVTVQPGDRLLIEAVEYRLTLDRWGYPVLSVV